MNTRWLKKFPPHDTAGHLIVAPFVISETYKYFLLFVGVFFVISGGAEKVLRPLLQWLR